MFSKVKNGVLVVDRRDVLTGAAALGVAALAPPSVAHAKGEEPTGQKGQVELDEAGSVDVSALEPGDLVVIASGTTYLGVLRRTAEQQEAARAKATERDETPDSDRVVDPEWLVVDMACPHRGCQVGYEMKADVPFTCPCHKSVFDSSGRIIEGKSKSSLKVPPHQISDGLLALSSLE